MAKSLRSRPIVERADDLLVNGNLRPGRKSIRGWDVCFHEVPVTSVLASPAGTRIEPTGTGHVDVSQSVRAYPNRRYRLDVRVETAARTAKTKTLAGKPPATRNEPSMVPDGSAASIQVRFASSRAGEEIRAYEPPVMSVGANAPLIHRAVFQCPPGTGQLQVRLRFQANEPIVVKRIRLVETGDYLLTSHVLANPPLPSSESPPHVPGSVLLCDGRRDERPLVWWLRGTFGEEHVQRVGIADLARLLQSTPKQTTLGGGTRRRSADHLPAVVIDLPEDRGPELQDLLAWSDRAIVIVSLSTFAAAASRAGVEGIRLQDRASGMDMPCGEIMVAGHLTHGFALADGMPYTWNDGQDNFAHRYLTMPKPAKSQLGRLGIQPAIVTECGQRDIDNHPLVLQRIGQRGALLVMDPDGLEQPSAGEDVPRMFDLLWRNALGQETVSLGQFSAPPTHYEGMLVDLVEVAKHYDLIEDVSVLTRLRRQGNWPPTWRLPSRRSDRFTDRPTLHIRTGFAEGDWPAVYALILWLKRLALAATRNEPAGRDLLQRMHVLAWPLAQPQAWRGCPKDVTAPSSEVAGNDLLGEIDLQVGQERQPVILVPDRDTQTMVRQALGKGSADIRVSASAFDGRGTTARARHLRCKVLLPGIPQPFPASSPFLTDLAAGLLQGLAMAVAERALGQ
jgi:hypothetical protein